MLVIRLQRTGRRNYPSFKIVVADKRNSSTAGRFVEEVGFYNPSTKEKILHKERITYWIGVGAQPSPTVHNMLVGDNIRTGTKIAKHKKLKSKGEAVPAAAAPVAPQPKAEEKPIEAPKPEGAA